MSQEFPPPSAGVPVWQQHWPVLLTGMGLAAAGAALAYVWKECPPLPRLLLLGVGLLLAGQAVVLRLRQGREEVEERIESAAVIALAGATALIALLGIDKEWDSAGTVLRAMLVVAVCGVVVVLLSGRPRRVVISLLALYHLGGIVTAITMLPPPTPGNAQPPFLATQAYVHLYRHYTNFIFMNNAYHFYSPEPGPPTLLWFSLNYEYTDPAGVKSLKSRWFKMPNREDSPVNLHYQRLLSITESVNSSVQAPPVLLAAKKQRRDTANEVGWSDRNGQVHPIQFPDIGEAPGIQYQLPNDWSNLMTSGVIRRVARMKAVHPDYPSAPLVSIKFYRVKHLIIPPQMMAEGYSPLDKRLYYVYYQGEYFPGGKLVSRDDPFLYWQIPITQGPDGQIQDHVGRHAAMDYNWKEREAGEKADQSEKGEQP